MIDEYLANWKKKYRKAGPLGKHDMTMILLELARKMAAALDKYQEQRPYNGHTETCAWTYNSDDDFWVTSCAEAYCLVEGGPKENSYNFCPNCGGKLIEPERKNG